MQQIRRYATAALLAGAALSLAGCRHEARERVDAFSWGDELAPGTTVHLRTMNGTVAVHGTPEPRLHVQGIKRWRHGRERDVRFVVSREGDDLYLCAIWVRHGGRCGEERYGPRPPRILAIFSLFRRRTDMSASFDVMLPPGVAVDASTVNGRVTVMDASGDVEAKTVNGAIDASMNGGGGLKLETVNGSIHARAVALDDDADVRLETVNGSIRAELPPTLQADVHLSTVNGRVATDFPLQISGKVSTHDLRGQIGGGGGRDVQLKTVNGSVELKRVASMGDGG